MVFSIQTQDGSLDIFKQDIAWEWKNFRFTDGLRDQFSTDIEIPKTNNNCDILGISGLLDSPVQLFGENIQPCILEIDGKTMDVYMQVVSINEDTITICLYERTLPQTHRDTDISRIVKDDQTTIMAWNIDTIPAYPDWFKEYNYGMPYDPKYAQRHPVKPVNDIIDNIRNELGIDIPYVSNDWYAMATLKKVCPQNTRQSVEGVWSDGEFHIMGGQHITNDLSFSYETTNTNKITFNRSCRVSIDLWISWQARELNGYNIPFLVNHWKASSQTNNTVEFRMRGDLYTNKVDRTSMTFDVELDDHISFGVVNADLFEMVRCLADLTITDYEITDDDYSEDLVYVGRLPRLVVYNYASGGYYYWYFDASQYDLAWHTRGVAGTKHQWLTTNWSSFAWYGYYCNLPEMKLGTFLYGLCWLMGKRIAIENGSIQFEDVNETTILENASITDIEPYSENFGMKNYIRWENEEFPKSVVDIDNEWLEPEHNLHVSPFGKIQNLSQFSGRVLQYENPQFEKGGDSESHHYSCDFNEIGYCIWWNVTSMGNMTIITPYIRDIPLKTMGLDEITQTMSVTIESMDYDFNVDYVYLDGRKFLVVEGSTDLNTKETTLTALLVSKNEDEDKSKPTTQAIWQLESEEVTNISCVTDQYGNTGMADVIRTATYRDINELSQTYNQTRTVDETVRVEDQTNCPVNTDPIWQNEGETMTDYECLTDDYGNTGQCVKTYTTTYMDINPRSATHGQTRTVTRTETVTDTTLCPAYEYRSKYFTITNVGSTQNTIFLRDWNNGVTVSVSKDNGVTWTSRNSGTNLAQLGVGESLLIKHNGALGLGDGTAIEASNYFEVSGNIGSLVFGDNFNNGIKTMPEKAFQRLFNGAYGHNYLLSAENLYFGDFNAVSDNGMNEIFRSCHNLERLPNLSMFRSVGERGFYNAFRDCDAIVTSPDFHNITSVGKEGFMYSFLGCSALATPPDLSNVTTLGSYGMREIFSNCSVLSTVYAPKVTFDSNKTYKWLSFVASTGTLYADASVINSIPDNSDSGCPSGWTKRVL